MTTIMFNDLGMTLERRAWAQALSACREQWAGGDRLAWPDYLRSQWGFELVMFGGNGIAGIRVVCEHKFVAFKLRFL